jgi:hypothetical protein
MANRTFEVGLHGIVCLESYLDEDNDYLEIRGTLELAVGREWHDLRERRTMWHIPNDEYVRIMVGEHNVHIIRIFHTVVVKEAESLWIGGHIAEEDDINEDDDMGHNFERLKKSDFDSLPPDGKHFPIRFAESLQIVRVDYTVKELH